MLTSLGVAGLLGIVGTRYRQRALITGGTLLSFRFVDGFLGSRPNAPAWPLWLVGWYLATAPVLFGGRGTPGTAARNAADTAFAFALPVAAAGFWVFVVWREVLEWGWGWLPEIRL